MSIGHTATATHFPKDRTPLWSQRSKNNNKHRTVPARNTSDVIVRNCKVQNSVEGASTPHATASPCQPPNFLLDAGQLRQIADIVNSPKTWDVTEMAGRYWSRALARRNHQLASDRLSNTKCEHEGLLQASTVLTINANHSICSTSTLPHRLSLPIKPVVYRSILFQASSVFSPTHHYTRNRHAVHNHHRSGDCRLSGLRSELCCP